MDKETIDQKDIINIDDMSLEEMIKNGMAIKIFVHRLQDELERERMRLAGCSVAALGYFKGCSPEYDSASLQDVLRLYEENEFWKVRLKEADPEWYDALMEDRLLVNSKIKEEENG